MIASGASTSSTPVRKPKLVEISGSFTAEPVRITNSPGALLILTGAPQKLPVMRPSYLFDTAIEDVYIPETLTEILPPYDVTIYTVSGQAVSHQRNVEQVNMNGLNNGLYLIQFEKNGQRVTKKVIR